MKSKEIYGNQYRSDNVLTKKARLPPFVHKTKVGEEGTGPTKTPPGKNMGT